MDYSFFSENIYTNNHTYITLVSLDYSFFFFILFSDLDVMGRHALEKYPVSYDESMNTVICQELGCFSNLLQIIESSLIGKKRERERDYFDYSLFLRYF